MKKTIALIIGALMLLSVIGAVSALPDEWGRGVNDAKGDVVFFDTKESGFFSQLFSTIGLFAVSDLEDTYQPGATLNLLVYSSLEVSCSEAYLTLEVYDAPIQSQTSSTYKGGDSRFLGSIGPGTYQSRISYAIPSNAEDGTWSVSGYIWCRTISGPASDYNSPVQEENFQVSGGQTSCTDQTNTGSPKCMTKGGYVDRYVGTYGNYDSDSCSEYPTDTDDMTDCFAQDKVCENGQCVTKQVTPVCGNGDKETGEECDDANTQSGDGCSATCKNENPTIPKLIMESNPEYTIDQEVNKVTVKFFLRNDGAPMTESNWILEVQPEPKSTGAGGIIQAIIPLDPDLQETCNTNFPQNVHKKLPLLGTGDTTTVTLEIQVPEEEINEELNTFLYPILRKDCFVNNPTELCENDETGCSSGNGCYQLPFCAGLEDVTYKATETGFLTGQPIGPFGVEELETSEEDFKPTSKKIALTREEFKGYTVPLGLYEDSLSKFLNLASPLFNTDVEYLVNKAYQDEDTPVCKRTTECDTGKCILGSSSDRASQERLDVASAIWSEEIGDIGSIDKQIYPISAFGLCLEDGEGESGFDIGEDIIPIAVIIVVIIVIIMAISGRKQ